MVVRHTDKAEPAHRMVYGEYKFAISDPLSRPGLPSTLQPPLSGQYGTSHCPDSRNVRKIEILANARYSLGIPDHFNIRFGE